MILSPAMLPESQVRPRTRLPLEELLRLAINPADRLDEFAPFLGERPGGTFMGDAPVLPRGAPATPAPPPIVMPNGQPTTTDPDIPVARPPIYSGERTEGLNSVGKLMLKKRLLSDPRNLNREVFETAEGVEVAPEGGPPSRKKQALMGLLQGLTMAGQQSGGDPWATLAGGATGAAAGGISPKLIKALTRDQEIQRVQGQINTEQKNTMGQAQIAETEAQSRQRDAQPEIEMYKLQRQLDNDAAVQTDRTSRAKTAEEGLAERRKSREEQTRHNKAVEGKVTKRAPRTLNGQFWEEDDNGVMRVKKGSPPPTPSAAEDRRGEKSADRTAKGVQAGKLYEKGAEYWDQAQKKRDEAKTLGASSTTKNKDTIARLTREAESLEAKTRDVQIKGDELAAESESEPTAKTGRTIEKAIEAFRTAQKREPTAEEIARMRRAL